MSATLEIYTAAVLTVDGVSIPFGSMSEPADSISVTGDVHDHTTGTLPISTTKVLWSYGTDKPDFKALLIRSSDDLDIEIKGDKPTSSTNSAPLGTYINRQTIQTESHGWTIITADQLRVDLSATAKSVSSLASATQGKVYEVSIRNNNASGDVDWECIVLN